MPIYTKPHEKNIISKVVPIDFRSAKGADLSDYNICGNMVQDSEQKFGLTGTPPLSFNSNGSDLAYYTVSGNMVQTGTPTPDNPIVPEECGDKTGNIFPSSSAGTKTNGGLTVSCDGNGVYTISSTGSGGAVFFDIPEFTIPVSVGRGGMGTFSIFNSAVADGAIAFYYGSTKIDDWAYNVVNRMSTGYIAMGGNTINKIRISVNESISFTIKPMFTDDGQLPSAYVQYGYAVPITIAGQTQTVYLSEPIRKIGNYTDTNELDGTVTRYIKALTFDGTENWAEASTGSKKYYRVSVGAYHSLQSGYAICTHFARTLIDSSTTSVGVDTQNSSQSNADFIAIRPDNLSVDYPTVAEWKSYLAQQYAAGTPVTVWYVLATAITESITCPALNTSKGNNTLSIDTSLNASEVSIDGIGGAAPYNIILPNECGEPTANMFNVNATPSATESYLTDRGSTERDRNYNITDYIPVRSNTSYWLSSVNSDSRATEPSVCFYNYKKEFISGVSYNGASDIAITTTSKTSYLKISYDTRVSSTAMLTAGSEQPDTYEPYGQYKIPITCGGRTKYVFALEPIRSINYGADVIDSDGVITRHICKIELDGTKTPSATPYPHTFRYIPSILDVDYWDSHAGAVCSHFSQTDDITNIANGEFWLSTPLYFRIDSCDTVDDFKAYLAAQYAKGTPVTLWYVLATPYTEQTTTPTITPSTGANTFSVETTTQPSMVSITVPDFYESISKIPIGDGTTEVKHVYAQNGNFVYKSPAYYTWEGIRKIVRAGLASTYYPLGSIIYDTFDPSTGTAFQVVGYDKHFDPSLTAQGYTHSMTLCQLKLDLRQFDATESMMYLTYAMHAGTYRFTIPNYDASYGGNKTYYFTTTADTPVGGVITLSWPYNQNPASVSTYATPESTTALNSAKALTVWDESVTATDLGTVTYSDTASTGAYGIFNHIHRARYGSNNYYQSGLRQLLNTDKAASTWWQATTIFDRPYSNRTSAGYLSTLNPDMIFVLGTPEISYRTNNTFEYPSIDGTTFTKNTSYTISTDKMFLLSHTEVNLSSSPNIGSVLDYYVNADNAKLIKYRKDNGNAYHWWLRAPHPSVALHERVVISSGALSYSGAYNSYGSAPACIIQ